MSSSNPPLASAARPAATPKFGAAAAVAPGPRFSSKTEEILAKLRAGGKASASTSSLSVSSAARTGSAPKETTEQILARLRAQRASKDALAAGTSAAPAPAATATPAATPPASPRQPEASPVVTPAFLEESAQPAEISRLLGLDFAVLLENAKRKDIQSFVQTAQAINPKLLRLRTLAQAAGFSEQDSAVIKAWAELLARSKAVAGGDEEGYSALLSLQEHTLQALSTLVSRLTSDAPPATQSSTPIIEAVSDAALQSGPLPVEEAPTGATEPTETPVQAVTEHSMTEVSPIVVVPVETPNEDSPAQLTPVEIAATGVSSTEGSSPEVTPVETAALEASPVVESTPVESSVPVSPDVTFTETGTDDSTGVDS